MHASHPDHGLPGSGKTTLLNRVLTDRHMVRSLMLINEFGEVGLGLLRIKGVLNIEGESEPLASWHEN